MAKKKKRECPRFMRKKEVEGAPPRCVTILDPEEREYVAALVDLSEAVERCPRRRPDSEVTRLLTRVKKLRKD